MGQGQQRPQNRHDLQPTLKAVKKFITISSAMEVCWSKKKNEEEASRIALNFKDLPCFLISYEGDFFSMSKLVLASLAFKALNASKAPNLQKVIADFTASTTLRGTAHLEWYEDEHNEVVGSFFKLPLQSAAEKDLAFNIVNIIMGEDA